MEYDEVTPQDLINLQNSITSQLEFFAEKILALSSKNKMLKTYDARVIGYPTEDEEDLHGPGAVQIDCPELLIGKSSRYFASQRNRSQEGVFESPSIDSWVSVYQDPTDEKFYILGYTFPIRPTYRSGEELGYTGATELQAPYKAGTKFDRVRKNPGVYRLLQSSKNFFFSEDRDAKELTLEVNSDWKINVLTKSNGKINIGSSGVGDSVDVNVDTSGTGKFKVSTAAVTMLTDANSTSVEVLSTKWKLTGTEVTLESTNIKTKGEWEHDGKMTVKKELIVEKDIQGKKEVFAMYGTPAQVSASKHQHPFAVPGPAAPPTPGI